MKEIKFILISVLLITLVSCTFEEIDNPINESEDGVPDGIEVETSNLSGIWKIEFYDVGIFQLDTKNAPLQYIRMTDSLFATNNYKGNLIFFKEDSDSLDNDFTFWRVENGNQLRFENEFDSEEVYFYEIERLNESQLILSETDNDDILAIFSKSNINYTQLQEFIENNNAKAEK